MSGQSLPKFPIQKIWKTSVLEIFIKYRRLEDRMDVAYNRFILEYNHTFYLLRLRTSFPRKVGIGL